MEYDFWSPAWLAAWGKRSAETESQLEKRVKNHFYLVTDGIFILRKAVKILEIPSHKQ